MALKNEIGNKYGALTVIARGPNTNEGRAQWVCECECGNQTVVLGKNVEKLGDSAFGGSGRGERVRHQEE